ASAEPAESLPSAGPAESRISARTAGSRAPASSAGSRASASSMASGISAKVSASVRKEVGDVCMRADKARAVPPAAYSLFNSLGEMGDHACSAGRTMFGWPDMSDQLFGREARADADEGDQEVRAGGGHEPAFERDEVLGITERLIDAPGTEAEQRRGQD